MLMWTCCQLTLTDPNSWLQSRDAKKICTFCTEFIKVIVTPSSSKYLKISRIVLEIKLFQSKFFTSGLRDIKVILCYILMYFTISISVWKCIKQVTRLTPHTPLIFTEAAPSENSSQTFHVHPSFTFKHNLNFIKNN